MNIDIINKKVSKELGLPEDIVKQVNAFYWRKIYNHLYSYNPKPVNIENICVFYPNKWKVKYAILEYITRIRKLANSRYYKEGSIRKQNILADYTNILNNIIKIRKFNKFTN